MKTSDKKKEDESKMRAQTLRFDEKQIRRAAKERLDPNNPVFVVLKQFIYEQKAKIRTKRSFRTRENDEAVGAYVAMNFKEFDGINARQRWANWRTLPRNLNGRLPDRPLKTLDLCCGVGQSTEVLAYYLPAGSEILGLEYSARFVEIARQRQYVDARGKKVPVQFLAQSVLETFRDPQGKAIDDASIDLVNVCGAVGHHFKAEATRTLAAEVSRVLKPGGLALIDSGRKGTPLEQVIAIFEERGFETLNQARSCVVDQNAQVCFRKPAV